MQLSEAKRLLKSNDFKIYFNFLNKHKHLMGFSDWIIILGLNYLESDSFAEVEPNIYEKTLKISLSKKFIKESDDRKCNILFHELVHGRISLFNKRVEELTDIEEEHLANDIVRGFERYKEFKLK